MTTFSALLSKGTTLSYKSGSTTKVVAGVKSIPGIGTDPEKIDITDLSSERKQYTKGLQDVDNLEFGIIYQGDNFSDIETLIEKDKEVEWEITYPDQSGFTFTGKASYKFEGLEPNQVVNWNLVIVVSDGPNRKKAPTA